MQARKAVPDRRRRRRSLLWRRFWQGKSFCWSKNFILTGIMEFGTGATPVEDSLDGDADKVKDRVISWARVSKWLPWMKIGDRDGVAVFHTAVMRLDSWDDLPDVVKNEIRENYSTYVTAPTLDDDRPNETSWTVTQKAIDAWRMENND